MDGGKPRGKKQCTDCKALGHTVDECRKKAAKEAAAGRGGGAAPLKTKKDCW